MAVRAVHLGPGCLGLALIVPILKKAGFDLTVVGQSPKKAEALGRHRRYLKEHPSAPGQSLWTEVELGPECVTTTFAEIDAVVRNISTDDLLLVTMSLGPAQVDPVVQAAVARLLAVPTRGTVLIPCENRVADECTALFAARRAEEPARFHVPEVMVDCMTDAVEIDRDQQIVVVACERYGEWVITPPPEWADDITGALIDAGVIVTLDFGPYATRKRWFVNGLQLGLALHSYMQTGTRLDEADADVAPTHFRTIELFAKTAEGTAVLEGVLAEIIEAWRAAYPDEPTAGIEEYAATARARVLEQPMRRAFVARSIIDGCTRGAAEHERREALEKLWGRLKEPLDALGGRDGYLAEAFAYAAQFLSADVE